MEFYDGKQASKCIELEKQANGQRYVKVDTYHRSS
jgi:hypothetical protein